MEEKNFLFEVKDIWEDFLYPHGQILHVLEKIDFGVKPDEVIAIIGPSGCGKSTLLRIIAGLIPPTKGKIFHHGKQLDGLMPEISIVFQNFALYPWMTVQENIEMALKAIHASTEEMEKKTKEAISLIGLGGFEEAYPREISGGMKQRVGIARALVRSPEILFMDEPFSNLDAFTAESLRSEVINLWSDKKIGLKSILLISHDIYEVAYMADRIIVLGMNPATVHAVIENKMARPRDYRSPEFLQLVEQLHDTYGRIEPPTSKPKPKKEKIGPLLSANPEKIIGLLGYLIRRGGSQDIFKIGAESNQHFDKMTVVLQAAELLDFIEMIHRTATITEKGREYFSAKELDRRKFWKKQLLTIPLFAKVVELLNQEPAHSINRENLLRFLNQELPYQNAHEQLNILILWGDYGGLFTCYGRTKNLIKLFP